VCRSAAGDCDLAEQCTGSTPACPPDLKQPADTACSDGRFCTVTDKCDANGLCVGTGSPCPGPNANANCAESCDETNHTCTAPDPEGASCFDGNQCTMGDTCHTGACQSGAPVTCPPGEVCNQVTGACGKDTVNCAVSCDDTNPCTVDTCQAGACVSTPEADGTSCEHPDACTSGGLQCADGACGVRQCDVVPMQVVENGVPQPRVDVDCMITATTRKGRLKNGSCKVRLFVANSSASLIDAAERRGTSKPKPTPLSDRQPKPTKIRNGHGRVTLPLNEQGRQLLDNSPDGTVMAQLEGKLTIGQRKKAINRFLTLRR
jgi:hypothetical protein